MHLHHATTGIFFNGLRLHRVHGRPPSVGDLGGHIHLFKLEIPMHHYEESETLKYIIEILKQKRVEGRGSKTGQ